MRTISLSLIVCLFAVSCQKADPRVAELQARLDKAEKRIDTLEKRPAGAAAQQRPRPNPNQVYNIPVNAEDVLRGDKNAKVTVVEGFDFACPYCALSRPAMAEVLTKRKDVRVVSKQFVVHPTTATLPALAVCAGARQGKGPELEDAVWAKAWADAESGRPRLDVKMLSQESLEEIAKGIGLNIDKLKSDMASDGCKQWLSRQQQELASAGVNGTPAFYINGRPYQGARTAEGFNAAIDEELKRPAGATATATN